MKVTQEWVDDVRNRLNEYWENNPCSQIELCNRIGITLRILKSLIEGVRVPRVGSLLKIQLFLKNQAK